MSKSDQRIADLSLEKRALLERQLQELQKGSQAKISIPKRTTMGPALLSFSQERLWFLSQLYPGQSTYNEASAYRFTGQLDPVALQTALQGVVQRHEILRTTYHSLDGVPQQIVRKPSEVPLLISDLSDVVSHNRISTAQEQFKEKIEEPFDLSRDLMLRASLFKLGDDDYILLVVRHHISSDAWSSRRFWSEVIEIYKEETSEKHASLPLLAIQYADYAVWQRDSFQGERLANQMSYWREQLADLPLLELSADWQRPELPSFEGAEERFILPPELVVKLRNLAGEEDTTLFPVLLSVFILLLSRLASQDDCAVGIATANRMRTELESLIGLFVNMLVIRAKLGGNPPFRWLLQQIRQTVLEAQENQDTPFEKLVEVLQPERHLNRSPLVTATFQFLELPDARVDLPGMVVEPVEVANLHAKFDMDCSLVVSENGIAGQWRYATDLFRPDNIKRVIGQYQTLLEAVANDPDCEIGRLPMLADSERSQLMAWNNTTAPFPNDAAIHHLFEAQVASQPNLPAVKLGEHKLTYSELNGKANQLAHYLRRIGLRRGALVGLCTGRSLEMITGILGILKAGGVYVPIDADYPSARQAFMLQDSGVQILLTQEQLLQNPVIDGFGSRISPVLGAEFSLPITICLDADWGNISQQSDTGISREVGANDLAYVIYTSGTTGLPKGTMLNHLGLCNLANWQGKIFDIRPGKSRVLQFSPLSFDASIWEIFMALSNGATLVLADQQTLTSGAGLVKLLAEEGVTHATLPPSMLAIMPESELPRLQTIIAAGEACPADLVGRWGQNRRFFNAYGPTEATVCAAIYRCDPAESNSPPIGRPIDNVQLFILDANLEPVPIGTQGELIVGGVNLARGYLDHPELTRDKFIHNPLIGNNFEKEGDTKSQSKLVTIVYRTGDLVRRRPDGNIEFLGRIDRQVKIRGVRVELIEIETVLLGHPDLQSAAVLAHPDNQDGLQLAAYVVANNEIVVLPSDLRAYLREKLPDHMVPSQWVMLEEMPLTPNHKIDHSALPEPEITRDGLASPYFAPRNDVEDQLTAIAGELLNVERVGINDSFFELGGHSLLATQYISRVRTSFEVELPLHTLFDNPTMAEIALEIETLQAARDSNRQKIEHALEQVSKLSPEEIKTSLAAKKAPAKNK